MKNKFVKFYITFLLFICSWQIANSQNINHPNIKCPGGVFVNSFNGNMNLKRNDLFIAGRKFNLDMAFYYNSFDAKRNFGYGNGWGFNYLMQYIKESSGIIASVIL